MISVYYQGILKNLKNNLNTNPWKRKNFFNQLLHYLDIFKVPKMGDLQYI